MSSPVAQPHLQPSRKRQTRNPMRPQTSPQILETLEFQTRFGSSFKPTKRPPNAISESSEQAIKAQRQDYDAKRLEQAKAVERNLTAQRQKTAGKKQEEIVAIERQREEARLKEQDAQIAAQKARAELERLRRVEETHKRDEARVQSRLQQIGKCVAGFQWIRQPGGYRCAGGSHFVTDAQLVL